MSVVLRDRVAGVGCIADRVELGLDALVRRLPSDVVERQDIVRSGFSLRHEPDVRTVR